MDYIEFYELLNRELTRNSLASCTEAEGRAFHALTELLVEVNAHTNLTAIRTVPETVSKHYVDSLTCLSCIPEGARVLDIGCGAGFPSLPLAILRPDLSITSLDSTGKKIDFVKTVAERIGVANIRPIAGRAEDPAIRTALGQFDVVVSRAVAELRILAELALPYLKTGGFLLAMKGSRGVEEYKAAERALSVLGGGTTEVISLSLLLSDGSSEGRTLIKTKKVCATPPAYPRPYASILKKPL